MVSDYDAVRPPTIRRHQSAVIASNIAACCVGGPSIEILTYSFHYFPSHFSLKKGNQKIEIRYEIMGSLNKLCHARCNVISSATQIVICKE